MCTFSPNPAMTTSKCTSRHPVSHSEYAETYPCLWHSSVKTQWGYHECPGVNILFSVQGSGKQILTFGEKQIQIINILKNRKLICTLQASPSSTATERASVGFSITLLFWPEKSIATREFSDILLWGKKSTLFYLENIFEVTFQCFAGNTFPF